MGGLIPDEVVESVRQATDIVQVIGEYVRLEKKGKNFVGICPFHQERDPSFTVSPEKQIFYCFGCGTGGNVFKFLMLQENLTFPEAVYRLARQAGITVPRTERHREGTRAWLEEQAWEINAMVRDFYHHFLIHRPEAEEARSYLERRGVSRHTREIFQLGYAPPGWDTLLQFLASRNCSLHRAVDLGLLTRGERGKFYDRFRNRLIFPIYNAQGRVVGFGGRVLDDSQPKYLNSPESPIFNKGKLLFGLHLARAAIREKGYAIIMEGYMDVITAYQHGVRNVVASLGTSLTAEQGHLLSRYTRDVVIAYDADTAGVAASIRGLDLLQQIGFRVRVVTLPEGKDPDEYIRQHGGEKWQQLVETATPLLDYKLNQAAKNGGSSASLLAQVLPNLAAMPGEAEREEGIRRVAARLSLSWEAVRDALRRFNKNPGRKWSNSDKIAKNKHNILANAYNKAELFLLQLLLHYPAYVQEVRRRLGESFPREPGLRRIFTLVCRGERVDPAAWMDELNEEEQRLLSRLLMEKIPGGDPVKIISDLTRAVERSYLQEQRERLVQELAEAERVGDQGRIVRVLGDLQKLLQKSKPLLERGNE
ncbi:DNA primase [Desulfofundulus thermocisternus]|uniref:DNA primase n=1 Tax=Desulfofundulus thermocisternus TaxID=42471 RepID=UPI00217D6CD1|nr:DNA primase [Desulfofundulus thermocisternus]MCS5696161.1 DNA primase [Desulfofundulus thermocisternus]